MAGTILFGVVAVRASASASTPTSTTRTSPSACRWPGASPEDVESGIVEPLEEALAQVEGVQTITSQARAGLGAHHRDLRSVAQHRSRAAGRPGEGRAVAALAADRRAAADRLEVATPTTRRSSRSASPARSRASCSPTSRATRCRRAADGRRRRPGHDDAATSIATCASGSTPTS